MSPHWKGCKSGKKVTRSTSALTPRKLKPESSRTAGGIWRLGLSPSREDLADGRKARPKAAGWLHKEWLQLLTSQLRLPITCTCKEEQDSTKMPQDRYSPFSLPEKSPSIQVSPLHQAHQKSHFLCEIFSSTNFLPALSHQLTLNW